MPLVLHWFLKFLAFLLWANLGQYFCNIIYKCITKILTNRLQPCWVKLSATTRLHLLQVETYQKIYFIAYGVKNWWKVTTETKGPQRCTIKVELMKAYDSVEWGFIQILVFQVYILIGLESAQLLQNFLRL